MLKSSYGTDKTLERDGVWFESDDGHNQVLIARPGGANKKYLKFIAEATRPHQSKIERNSLATEIMEKINRESFCLTCIKGWRYRDDLNSEKWIDNLLLIDEGETVEFSTDAALLVMEEYPDFFSDLQKMANNFRAYSLDAVESASGN